MRKLLCPLILFMTVPIWAGVAVNQGDPNITIGSMTVTGAGIQFSNGSVQSAAAVGGASALGVFSNGVLVSTPTSALNTNTSLLVTLQGSNTAQFAVNPASATLQGPVVSSITINAMYGSPILNGANISNLQATNVIGTIPSGSLTNAILNQNSLQSGSTFYVSSATVANALTIPMSATPDLANGHLSNNTTQGTLNLGFGSSAYNIYPYEISGSTPASGHCLEAGSFLGEVVDAGSACGSGGGGGGGYAVQPATVAFQLNQGVSGSTASFTAFNATTTSMTVTGSGGLGVTYGVSAGSLTLTGASWPNFTPFDGNIYNWLGTSTTPVAVGDFMAYASTSGSVQDIGSTIPASKIGAGALGAGVIASSLTASGVTAGSYTNTNLTVNAEGQVTSASNGSGGSFQGVGISASPLLTSSATLVAGTNVTLSQTGSSITINSGGGTTLSHVGWCDPQTCAININNTVSLSSGIPHCVGFFAPGGSNTVVVSTVSFWIDAATSTAIGFYTSAGNLISQSNMTSASNDRSILQMSPPVSLSGGSYYYICSAVPANRGQQDSYLDQYTYVNYAMNAGSDASNCQAFDAANHATFTTVSVLPATLGAVRTCGTTIGGNGVNAGTRPYYQFY